MGSTSTHRLVVAAVIVATVIVVNSTSRLPTVARSPVAESDGGATAPVSLSAPRGSTVGSIQGPETILQRPTGEASADLQQDGGPQQIRSAPRSACAAGNCTQAPAPSPVPFAVIGVATSPKNTGHRSWIRATWMTLPNVRAGSVRAVFLLGVLSPHGVAHPSATRRALRREQRKHRDMLLLNARETKPPGEKMIGFFRWCATAFGAIGGADGDADGGADGGGGGGAVTRYCVKTDDVRATLAAIRFDPTRPECYAL